MQLIVATYQNQTLTHEFLDQNENMDGPRFLRFLRDNLAPSMERAGIHRPVLLMDNAPSHFTPENSEFIFINKRWDILPQPSYRYMLK